MKPTVVRIEKVSNAILVASYGTLSTGVNIRRLHHIVLGSPSKSRYRVLQSIGRGLRLHATKRVVYVMDIVDDARVPTHVNYGIKHWAHRAKFYKEETFPVELYSHQLKGYHGPIDPS